MQNKKILLSVLIGISAVGTALSSFGLTKAWFASGTAFGNQNLEASSVSNYFAGGDGSEDNPFLIKEPIHMYNLSWLQARGIFDTEKKYFKVADAEGGGAVPRVPCRPYGLEAGRVLRLDGRAALGDEGRERRTRAGEGRSARLLHPPAGVLRFGTHEGVPDWLPCVPAVHCD